MSRRILGFAAAAALTLAVLAPATASADSCRRGHRGRHYSSYYDRGYSGRGYYDSGYYYGRSYSPYYGGYYAPYRSVGYYYYAPRYVPAPRPYYYYRPHRRPRVSLHIRF